MNWTEVISVESIGNPTKIFVGRSRHYISRGDRITFRGDSHPEMFTNGKTYRYIGQTQNEPNDSVFFEDSNGGRIKLYREDFEHYLLEGCFEIHDV